MDADAMPRLEGFEVQVAIVAVGDEQVGVAVAVEVGEFQVRVSPGRVSLQLELFLESAVALVEEEGNAFAACGHQRNNVLASIAVEVVQVDIDGAGARD
jgi:citrate lyase gamma subunit